MICKGCNKEKDILFPSPKALQNMDSTGEIITELCQNCCINLLNAIREETPDVSNLFNEKIKDIEGLLQKSKELGIELPKNTSISVESLKELVKNHEK